MVKFDDKKIDCLRCLQQEKNWITKVSQVVLFKFILFKFILFKVVLFKSAEFKMKA